jgi:two-component system, chemotaxis family, sensor kinase CheA
MADEIFREFLTESNENLDKLDRELVLLEKDPQNLKILGSVFRSIHTIKGTCGFLGFTTLEKVAHVGENLLSNLRDGKLALNTDIASGLLSMVDAVRHMLGEIQRTGQDGRADYRQLIERLRRLQQPMAGSTTQNQRAQTRNAERRTVSRAAKQAPSAVSKNEPKGVPLAPPDFPDTPGMAGCPSETPQTDETDDQPMGGKIGGALVEQGKITPGDLARALQVQGKRRRLGEILVDSGVVSAEDVLAAERVVDGARTREGGATTIRVDVSLLDKLMNLVGELVLVRNRVLQFTPSVESANLVATSQRLNLITSELQESVMKTRMQPIGNVWSKFPRTVRDVAMNCGKQVRIEMIGQETELDKTIIEAIKDPLTHLVRNSVDHGIERPEARLAAGKEAEGCLTLRAYHEGGQVNIEISDDGAGLDQEKIKRKAIDRELLSPEKAAKLSERDAFNLIFLPGFSTAERVTNVSGRGVGMDVVKTNIEKIGGTVDVQSGTGTGTTVKMKIPLTLAIIPGLVVCSADKRFVIPQVSLTELVRIDPNQTHTGIEMVHGVPVYRLRKRLLPLVYLDRELGIEKRSEENVAQGKAVNIAVLQADGCQFGLIVDEIRDTEEIVVKPLGRRLKGIKTFAGATIMGDGKVALILDVLGLAQRAGVISEQQDHALAEVDPESQETTSKKQTFLVFAGPDDARMALPLGALARLEVFPASLVEKSGTQSVIQYRGHILPLIHLSVVLEERRRRLRHPQSPQTPSDPSSIQVLVCNHEGHSAGLVVEQILDIVEDQADVKSPATRAGVLYAAVIENRVTELLDLDAILRVARSRSEHEEEHAKVGN